MTIGGLSRHTGCKIVTIRYYETIGILPKPSRTEGGHRLYTMEHLKSLTFIRRARTLGFTLEAIRELLALAEGRETSCEKVRAVGQTHLAEIRERISDLQTMESVLKDLVKRCKGKAIPECLIIETLSGKNPPSA